MKNLYPYFNRTVPENYKKDLHKFRMSNMREERFKNVIKETSTILFDIKRKLENKIDARLFHLFRGEILRTSVFLEADL